MTTLCNYKLHLHSCAFCTCTCLILLQLLLFPWCPQARPLNKPCGISPAISQATLQNSPEKQLEKRMLGGGGHDYNKKQLAQIEKRMGSRPPLCSNKCNACSPCEAVQVPTPLFNKGSPKINGLHVAHVDYSNYQPEGWKCKCGNLIYNP